MEAAADGRHVESRLPAKLAPPSPAPLAHAALVPFLGAHHQAPQ